MEIIAAILAGGVGTRIRSVLPDQPKALATVNGAPFLSFLLDQLAEAGASRVILCAGYRGEQLWHALPLLRNEVWVVISQEDWPLGTAGALRQAVDRFAAETLLVLHGDSYVDTSLAGFCQWRESQPFQSALLLTWAEDCARSATVQVDPAGRILAFHKARGLKQPGWVDAGVYLLSRAWLEELPLNAPLSLERDVFPYWIERGLGGHCVQAPFLASCS